MGSMMFICNNWPIAAPHRTPHRCGLGALDPWACFHRLSRTAAHECRGMLLKMLYYAFDTAIRVLRWDSQC